MINFLEMFGLRNYQANFWSRPHPEGALFYFEEKDIDSVKKNVRLPDDKIPSSPDEIIEAATNGLGTLMRTNVDGAKIELFVQKESLPFAKINMTVFAGLTEGAD